MGGVGDFFNPSAIVSLGVGGFGDAIGFGIWGLKDALTRAWEYPSPWEWGGFLGFDIPNMGASYGDSLITRTAISIPVPIAFGKIKTAGNMVRAETAGENDTYRNYIVAFCQGEISSYDSVYINDILWADLTEGFTHTKTEYTGTFAQTADARFTNQAQAYRGTAYIAFTLHHTKRGKGRPPNMQVMNANFSTVLDGTECTPIAGGAATFTRNPAVILWHIYTQLEGRATSELDQTAFQALETYCDAVPDGGTLPRYRFDFIFDANTTINDMKKYVFKSFNGTCVWSQDSAGNSVIKPVWSQSSSPIHTFDHDNIVAGSFSWAEPQQNPNVIKINYINSGDDYKKDFIEMRDETSISLNGEIDFDEIAYFLTDEELVARRARFIYSRFKYTDYNCRLASFPESSKLEIYDIVRVTHTLPGFSGKQFVIVGKKQNENGLCEFELDAYHSSIHDDRAAEIQHDYSTTLPNPFATPVDVKNLVLTESSVTGADGKYVPTVLVNFDAPTTTDSLYWSHAEIWTMTNDSGSTWAYYGNAISGSTYTVDGIRAGFCGYMQGGVTVDIAARSMHAAVHGFIAQDLESAASASENIDQLPYGYFTVSSTPGLGMFTSVTKAVESLPALGGYIFIKNGTYSTGSGVSYPQKNIFLEGESRSGVTLTVAGNYDMFQIDNKRQWYAWKNMTMVSGQTTPVVFGSGDFIINCGASAFGEASSNLIVDSCNFNLVDNGEGGYELGVQGTSGDTGIGFSDQEGGSADIRNCKFIDGRYGIYSEDSDDLRVRGCVLSGQIDASIYHSNYGPEVPGTIYGNIFREITGVGITVAGDGNVVSHNTISSTTDPVVAAKWFSTTSAIMRGMTISGENNIVSSNTVKVDNAVSLTTANCDIVGVALSGSESTFNNNQIYVGCTSSIAVYGLDIDNVYTGVIEGNRIAVLNDDDQTASYGFNANNMGRSVVSNNIVQMQDGANDNGFVTTSTEPGDGSEGTGNISYDVNSNSLDADDNFTVTNIS